MEGWRACRDWVDRQGDIAIDALRRECPNVPVSIARTDR